MTVLGDTATEPNETFTVNLSGATNAPIGDAQGVGTIVNDDAPPAPIDHAERHHGGRRARPITFTIQNGPGNPADWVGFYRTGNGQRGLRELGLSERVAVAALTGLVDGNGAIHRAARRRAPTTARLFANNGWGMLAVSSTVTVTP